MKSNKQLLGYIAVLEDAISDGVALADIVINDASASNTVRYEAVNKKSILLEAIASKGKLNKGEVL